MISSARKKTTKTKSKKEEKCLKGEMQIDRAKSQRKCRSDKYILHKDTYHIINVTETQQELQLITATKKKTNHKCGAPE